jgi:predicted benzoate:H+ symporter BenE
MNLVSRKKAQKTQVSKLENHKLGLGLISMVSSEVNRTPQVTMWAP